MNTELLPTLAGHNPPGYHAKAVTAPALTLGQLDAMVGRYIVGHPPPGPPGDQVWFRRQ